MLRQIQHFTITLIALFLISGVFSLAQAQQIAPDDPIQTTITPTNPEPLQDVKISIVSYLTDLRGASIIWYVDGKKVAEGSGLVSIIIKAPANGKTATINIIANLSNGTQMKKNFTISSGQVDILWESNGSVPAFYRGKSLYGVQNIITFAAMPSLLDKNGKMIDPKNLIYNWKKDSKVLFEQSGAGRQTLKLKGDVLDSSFIINLVVTSKDGLLSAESNIGVESVTPKILFYESDPLYGTLYNKALISKFPLTNSEITTKAVPMFFSKDEMNLSMLKYIWLVNGIERADLSTKDSITLRTDGKADGSALVSLRINNIESLLQSASAGFETYFTKKPPQNITF